MTLPSLLYDLNTDAAGNGTLITAPLSGWLSEIQVNYVAGASAIGTLTVTAEFNNVTETLLTGIIGNTDNTFPVSRPLVTSAGASANQPWPWSLSGQRVTVLLNNGNGVLTPALQIKFGGSRHPSQ